MNANAEWTGAIMFQHSNELLSLQGKGGLHLADWSEAANCRTPELRSTTDGRKKADDPEKFRYLIARPAARSDLDSILEIAKHVNLASMRSEKEKNQVCIEQSIRTLAGELSWQQGLLFLSADLFPSEGGSRELAGNAKLQIGWGGYWKKQKRTRLFNFPGLQTWAEQENLTYHPHADNEYTLEFAGLTVLPSHQGKKISRFLTEAWVLFVLQYAEELERRIGSIAHLYGNLLTADTAGKYPFYESVVKPLFGGLDYDMVDAFRYVHCNARSPILDEFLDQRGDQPRASILTHLLPEEIRQNLGKVRDQTIGCQKNLERFGFERVPKYDVLDGGQYFENTLAKLDRVVERQEYLVRCVPAEQMQAESAKLTIAPAARPMPHFRCARVNCRVEGRELLLGEDVFDELLLRHHEPVVALKPR
jgi:arginine/ornithine N-succinyltransferase beta subunit